MRKYTYIYNIVRAIGILLLAACTDDVVEMQQPGVDDCAEAVDRELTHITFTASLEQNDTRVTYTQGAGELTRSWAVDETLGVYIRKTDGNIIYAGTITSSGQTTDVTRTFEGNVTKLESGETYIYMHPNLGGTIGEAATATIDYTSQSVALGSTSHLANLIPMIWRNGRSMGEMQGYVIRLQMTFNENPGAISAVKLQTMSMGDAGTTEDRVFPVSFKTANLGNAVNSVLPSAKTSGTSLASNADYTNTITANVSGSATGNGDGTYSAEVYLVSADVENIDVFRSKYNVKVEAANGTYYSSFKSFLGQTSASASTGLPMLANGKSYKLAAKMSKGYAPTIISEQFKVNSLLGMWNQYGKAYDPQGLVTAEANWPAQLRDNKTAIESRAKSQSYAGTPSWLGPVSGSLYATGHADDLKQDNVTFNNIQITAETEVFFTIISEFGWNQNLLGYYYYPTANEGSVNSNSVTKNIIFADVSKPNHEPFAKGVAGHKDVNNVGTPAQAPIQEFETVKLLYTDENGYTSTKFPAGTTIGFWMMIDPEANIIVDGDGSTINGYNHRQYDLMRWNQWRLFTNSAWNAQNTIANGAVTNWPSTGYTNSNFFASGDVCNGSGNPIEGLAIYGVKDNGTNIYNYAYGAMIFMVSTSIPSAMQTHNQAYFNIGSDNLVIGK
ncbi:MAG: hypothetical protein KBT20_01425 [Bacteroidales bacterium]|nr:hypothetical protein [Candidatus Liminaster caballi]